MVLGYDQLIAQLWKLQDLQVLVIITVPFKFTVLEKNMSHHPISKLAAVAALSGTTALLSAGPNIVVNSNTTRTGSDYISGTATITINNGATLTLGDTSSGGSPDYLWSGWSNGTGKSYWDLNDGNIVVSADAELNNNEPLGNFKPDAIINARPFVVWGNPGGNDTIEFEVGFNADMGASSGGAGPTNPVGGLSTLRVNDTIIRTHHQQNLPSVWKHTQDNQGGGIAETHHGLLIFEDGSSSQNPSGNSAKWEVRTNTQMYDGGINWSGAWTLDVASGLQMISDTTYEQNLGPHVGFGEGRGTTTGHTLTKIGDGDLVIARGGVQHYAPGAKFDIKAGGVEFNSDPTSYGTDKPTYYATDGAGQNLEIDVDSVASATFNSYTWPFNENWYTEDIYGTDNLHRIKSLESNGLVKLGGLSSYTPRGVDLNTPLSIPETASESEAILKISGNATFQSNSELVVVLGAGSESAAYQIEVGGTASLDGNVDVETETGYVPLPGTSFTLIDANSRTGTFDNTTISDVAGYAGLWMDVTYTGGLVEVTSDALPGDANLDGTVDGADLSILASNFGAGGGWVFGNYNGDAGIDGADLSILSSNFGASVVSAPAATPIPEPASLPLLVLGGLALIRRR